MDDARFFRLSTTTLGPKRLRNGFCGYLVQAACRYWPLQINRPEQTESDPDDKDPNRGGHPKPWHQGGNRSSDSRTPSPLENLQFLSTPPVGFRGGGGVLGLFRVSGPMNLEVTDSQNQATKSRPGLSPHPIKLLWKARAHSRTPSRDLKKPPQSPKAKLPNAKRTKSPPLSPTKGSPPP